MEYGDEEEEIDYSKGVKRTTVSEFKNEEPKVVEAFRPYEYEPPLIPGVSSFLEAHEHILDFGMDQALPARVTLPMIPFTPDQDEGLLAEPAYLVEI